MLILAIMDSFCFFSFTFMVFFFPKFSVRRMYYWEVSSSKGKIAVKEKKNDNIDGHGMKPIVLTWGPSGIWLS